MKEKKMFGKGEKRAASLRVSLWVTRFQPTDNGYIGLFWKRERKGKREKEKLDCARGSVGASRKKKRTKIEGKKERTMLVVRGGGKMARGRLLSFESRGSFPFTGDLPVPYRPSTPAYKFIQAGRRFN